ncbi:MAG: 16S rRNA (adenine(1518)-N(6)/adenine(1519)-N(6))-dimethyltransferase RsmA [Chloroflexota bacterium]
MSDTSHRGAAAILRSYGIRPRHRLGQNFLHDPEALQRIVDAAGIENGDVVLEIGCGIGSLTRYLAQAAHTVVAIELDGRLAAIAQDALAALRNVRVVCGDFIKLTPRELNLPSGYIVAANIPYYITSPILRHLLESEPMPRRCVLTVQKEVAGRICAKPPDMSLLAVSVQVYGSTQVVARIPAVAFYPSPKVDSAVVRVECHDQPMVHPSQLSAFFRVVKAGFRQPRKMLRNTFATGLALSSADAHALLAGAGIDPRRRAETLTLKEWIRLSEVVSSRAV